MAGVDLTLIARYKSSWAWLSRSKPSVAKNRIFRLDCANGPGRGREDILVVLGEADTREEKNVK